MNYLALVCLISGIITALALTWALRSVKREAWSLRQRLSRAYGYIASQGLMDDFNYQEFGGINEEDNQLLC